MPQAQQLGRYQLLDRIAFGGMAEIYRAKTFDAEGRARLVAVKRVLQHLTSDDDFIRMLVDEAKITAILDHPSIARVYEFSQTGSEYFIAMEYVDGKDVRAVLEKHRQAKQLIAPEHVAWVIAHVAEGLHAAHMQSDADGRPMNIVHRDVSPSNILCSYQGDAKLCDFGIAKATLTRVQTRTGVIKGKVKYMSPEQAMGRKLDARSDLFSLGTVMYEMLTLEAPFTAQTEVELIFAVRDARKRDARTVVPTIPEALNNILNRLMQRQRTDRYQSGRELAKDLYTFLEKQSPGYRRANMGRFMREHFKVEIEKELRQLEEWVIGGADASIVGVNLIADALPENAPYTGFSAVSSGAGSDPSGVRDMPAAATAIYGKEHARPPANLHAAQTQILNRADLRPTRDLHQRETMMLEGRDAEALRQQLRNPKSVHENETQLFDDPAPVDPSSSSRELPEIQTKIAPPSQKPKGAPPPKPKVQASKRSSSDTAPDINARTFNDDSRENTMPKSQGSSKVITDFGEDEASVSANTNPLADSDLEIV